MPDAATAGGDVAAPTGERQPRPAWDWNRLLTPRIVLLALPLVVLAAVAYGYPLARWEAVWRHNSAWGHGYLIPMIAVLIAHYRLNERVPRRLTPSVWGLPLIMAGLVIRIWSQTLKYGYPGDATFLLVVAGIVLLVLGWDLFRSVWVSVVYLGLMIPWDTKYYEGVALPLQTLAAAGAQRILGIGGILCTRRVNVLELASGDLAVAEACSGLHLLFAFVALGVMMAYIYRRPLWERLVIMISSVPIAVLCNVIRVTLMAVASDHLFFERQAVAAGAPTWSRHVPAAFWGLLKGDDLVARLEDLRQTVLNPESLLHQSFGFAMLALAFVLMWAELRIIDMFFVEERTHDDGPAAPQAASAADRTPAA